MSKLDLSKAMIVCVVSAFTLNLPVGAQNYSPEQTGTLSQVDITQGIAEQSAMHAMSTGYVPAPQMNAAPQYPQQQLQGFASQNYNNMPQAQQASFQGAQNYNNAQGYNNGQNFNNNMAQNQQQQSFSQGCAQQQQCNSNYNNGQSHSTGTGINTQMVGVLGAALLMNYATNGGATNVLGEMRSRGFNNRFHTFGSCIGGNVYH